MISAVIDLAMEHKSPTELDAKDCSGDDGQSNYKINKTNLLSHEKLGLKDWLDGFLENTNKAQIFGGPRFALKSITLTTSFQVILDGSAGLVPIIKIIPLASGFPSGSFKADHLHMIKIVFQGKCKIGDTPCKPAALEKEPEK